VILNFAIFLCNLQVIGMAQDYVGSNNINLLVPSGQFGTRLAGGEDAASPRYIFTHLSPVARHLFPEDDDILLQYLEDDGQMIEPQFFCPIIPLLIVNGSQGIGTGWSTFIPPHDPRSVLDYIRAKLENKQSMPAIEPYARGFSGIIEREAEGRGYVSYGRVEQINNKTVLIDELPIGTWTNSYKAQLLTMRDKGVITDFEENHTTTKVSFKVQLKPLQLSKLKKTGLEKAFKLKSNLLLTNMNAFDSSNSISQFDSAEAIADAYFPTRMSLYHDRKSVLESEMNYAATVLRNKARFIKAISGGEVDLIGGRSTKEDTVNSLRNLGFHSVSELETIRKNNSLNRDLVEEGETSEIVVPAVPVNSHFDYLLNMPLSSLQVERIEGLRREATKTEKELHDIKTKRPEDLWMADLEKLAPHL
jgi:DNA topoisomerase-2